MKPNEDSDWALSTPKRPLYFIGFDPKTLEVVKDKKYAYLDGWVQRACKYLNSLELINTYQCPGCNVKNQNGIKKSDSTPEKTKTDLKLYLKLWKSVEFLMNDLFSAQVSTCFLQQLLPQADCNSLGAIKEEIKRMRQMVEEQLTHAHIEKNNEKRGVQFIEYDLSDYTEAKYRN